MSKPEKNELWTDRRRFGVVVGVAAAAALVGAFLGRELAPRASQTVQQQPQQPQQRRPIVQIGRAQAPLPSLAGTVDTACPSIASLLPAGSAPAQRAAGTDKKSQPSVRAGAFVVSADGWLLTSADVQSAPRLEAIFSDGRRLAVSTLRTDPVSGLAIAKVAATGLPVLTFADQDAPAVGDFGLTLQTPAGRGCSAQMAMIGSDFLADGGGPVSYVRMASPLPDVLSGAPFLAGDGNVSAIATDAASTAGQFLPAAIARTVVDELIRNTPSPSIAFGLRASDTAGTLSSRLPDSRSRGAGIALVQPGSPADKAGLRPGDLVVAVDGTPLSSASELNRALDAAREKAVLTVMRGDQRSTVQVARSASSARKSRQERQ